ncbi:MAG: pseudouridine synthase [Sulfurovum sp.]|nr:pseudouridine synthase [Sulfurovum sp.]
MHNTSNLSKNLLALHKPKGYIVTRSDERGRKTVYDLLPKWAFDEGWMPIGRLDLDSKGLLLFTKDGQIGNYLTKPGGCIKVYEIWVRGHVTEEHIEQAKRGIESDKHGLLKAIVVEKLGTGGAKTKLKVVINEGKNRHIRRLFGAMNDPKFHTPLKVLALKRICIGNFKLDIISSKWRFLTKSEENMLIGNFAQQ